MRSDETLCEYTNRYFENRNTLVGVKDNDVITYYKKGITNIKLFEKIHEADAKTIGDLMAYVDKLVDTQDTVMHDFNREDQLSRRFASVCPMHLRKSSSGPTSTPNRNSRSPVSSGTTLTSSHGVHPIFLVSPGSLLSTNLKLTRPHDLSSKSSDDLQKIENKL
jgi:hypothetical protein